MLSTPEQGGAALLDPDPTGEAKKYLQKWLG